MSAVQVSSAVDYITSNTFYFLSRLVYKSIEPATGIPAM